MKTDKNRYSYKKGTRLATEIIDIMNDTEQASPLDKYPELSDAIKNNEYTQQLIDNLTNAQTIKETISRCGNPTESSNKFLLKIKYAKRRQQQTRRLIAALSVASAMAVISFAFYYTFDKTSDYEIRQEIFPKIANNNAPTIIFDNGEEINLTESNKIESKNFQINANKLTYNDIEIQNRDSVKFNTLVIPSEYTYCIILNDKTEIYLNANSKLKYPDCFVGENREVYLEGEGYFKVTKSDKPFIVNVRGASIKVYGTQFNINTHKKESIETLLVEGSVGITSRGTETMIKPNQLYHLNTVTGENSVKSVDTEEYLAWRSGMFKYTNRPLHEILDEMASWYGIEFNIKNKAYRSILLNMSLYKNSNIDEMITILEISTNLKFIKEGGCKYSIE